ncbi:PadR family transcriptional regulator [Halarsenatibacter silvermanii]|uniref:DNA-binding transcriptional regulator, PadR family n=1 Tax=Halarsenatibacter silvermanii TaxID=321763 RepID=A0A1G9RXZ4_9FIRM|nr:PadR family transcriptional regulator [Halarsenatibacter silvermanii]SDM28032.1 DNA-binding transcriptional regulator, PadR family [Halarsenatibacter silvermanii]
MTADKTDDDSYLDTSYWNGMIKMSLSRLFILRCLFEEPMHGYAITKRISELTSGCCAPTEGSLYPALNEFQKKGYVTSESRTVNGRERKTYKLTDRGEEAYRTGLEAWEETAEALLEAKKELELSG